MPPSYRNVCCSHAGSFTAPWIYFLSCPLVVHACCHCVCWIFTLSLYVYCIPRLSLYICCINIYVCMYDHIMCVLLYTYVCHLCMYVAVYFYYMCVAFVCVLHMYSFIIYCCVHSYMFSLFPLKLQVDRHRQHLLHVTLLHIQNRVWPTAGTHFSHGMHETWKGFYLYWALAVLICLFSCLLPNDVFC